MAKTLLLAALLFSVVAPTEAASYRLECPSPGVDRAIRGCTIAIGSAVANIPTAYANRCIAYWLKGAYERAAADCNKAIQLGGAFAVAHLIRGIGLADKGDHQAAIADYSRSLELFPTTSTYYNRGTAYLNLTDYPRALADFNNSIATPPGPPQAHINRALALLPSGRMDHIFAALDRGLELLPGDPFASAIRTYVLYTLRMERGELDRSMRPGKQGTIQPFPPSKVLPESLSIESFSASTLTAPVALNAVPTLALLRAPQSVPAKPMARRPAHTKVAPSGARDSLAECLRLWHPETRATQRQWHDICRSLDFSPKRW